MSCTLPCGSCAADVLAEQRVDIERVRIIILKRCGALCDVSLITGYQKHCFVILEFRLSGSLRALMQNAAWCLRKEGSDSCFMLLTGETIIGVLLCARRLNAALNQIAAFIHFGYLLDFPTTMIIYL